MLKGAAGVDLSKFTKRGGLVNISATFAVHLDLKVSMSGTTCSENYQWAKAFWLAEGILVNWTAGGTAKIGNSKGGGDFINSSRSVTIPFNYTHSLKWTANLQASATYSIGFAFSYDLTVSVANPLKNDPDSCSASASILPTSGSDVITLTDVIIL